jgi:YidC/Oxa1 family membrane protein insertase
MDAQRLIALIVFTFSGLMLWEAWQKHNVPAKPAASTQVVASPNAGQPEGAAAVPTPSASTTPSVVGAAAPSSVSATDGAGEIVKVRTDLFDVEINTRGGDIRRLVLRKQFSSKDRTRPLTLLSESEKAFYITQTGLLGGKGFPNHNSLWKAAGREFVLPDGGEQLEVKLTNGDIPGVNVEKVWRFRKGSYLIGLDFVVRNEGGAAVAPLAYVQFARDGKPPEEEASPTNPFSGVTTFFGPAVFTGEKKFQKVDFSAIDKGKADHVKEARDGWIGIVQHYFVGAWLAPRPAREADGRFRAEATEKREFYTRKISDAQYEVVTREGARRISKEPFYTAGSIFGGAAVAPGGAVTLASEAYIGPQETDRLASVAPGLDLVVDYGIFTIIAAPLFWILKWIHGFVGNWGWAIVLLTVLIKGVFYPLNAKAGRSMAQMKVLAPKLEALKSRYGDDRMKLNQAMMELYKTEKINPLGGCLPILVQIPVFIALYWVLLAAIELRHAPWIGWIQDLSAPDPYYVLPVLYAISMFIQTKLNPQPADPVQAKVMLAMPIVFSVFFLFFPAGLVLYWFVQNLIGIAQQWHINRTIEREQASRSAAARR